MRSESEMVELNPSKKLEGERERREQERTRAESREREKRA
jgi:hypothetical protein